MTGSFPLKTIDGNLEDGPTLENPAKIPTKEIPQVHAIETDHLEKRDRKTRELPRDTVVSQTLSLERLLLVGPKITPPPPPSPLPKGLRPFSYKFLRVKRFAALIPKAIWGRLSFGFHL
jgi:hypothetical protein